MYRSDKKAQSLVKRDIRQEAGAAMVSRIDGAADEAGVRGSLVGGGGEAGGRLQAEERAGKDSRPRINNSTLNKPPRTPGSAPNMPPTHASTHLQMFTSFKEQKKVI